jgi:hypothetical protein
VVATNRPARLRQQPRRRLDRDEGDYPRDLRIGRPQRAHDVGVRLGDQAANGGLVAVELA